MISIETQKKTGIDLEFTCPSCRQMVAGTSYQNNETLKVLHVLPVLKWNNTYIRCGQCRKNYPVKATKYQLKRMTPDEITQKLSVSSSSSGQLCAILSILTGITGILGIIFGFAGIIINRKAKGWPLIVSAIGLIGSLIWTVISLATAN